MTASGSHGIIILAAGNSSRLGRPKQLLHFHGQSLITSVCQKALKVTPHVVVVTGEIHDLIRKELVDLPVFLIQNVHWQDGMASSIVAGLDELMRFNSELSDVIITVCDQPFVSIEVFQGLINASASSGIAASSYGNTMGTPALFNKRYFAELLRLKGNEGAKRLMMQNQGDLSLVAFPLGNVDIDTEEDYRRLSSGEV